jgi:hypothetical protein
MTPSIPAAELQKNLPPLRGWWRGRRDPRAALASSLALGYILTPLRGWIAAAERRQSVATAEGRGSYCALDKPRSGERVFRRSTAEVSI